MNTLDVFVTPERLRPYPPITHAELFGNAVRKNDKHYQETEGVSADR